MGSGRKWWVGVLAAVWFLGTACKGQCHKVVLPLLIAVEALWKQQSNVRCLVYVAFPCSSTRWLQSEAQFRSRFVIAHRFFSRTLNKGTPYIRGKEGEEDRTGKMVVTTLEIVPSSCSAFSCEGVNEIIKLRNRKCMFLIRHLNSS